jgi:hypothetical protein
VIWLSLWWYVCHCGDMFVIVVICLLLWWYVCHCGDMFVIVVICLLLWWYVCYCGDMFVIVVICLLLWWYVCHCGDMFVIVVICLSLWWYVCHFPWLINETVKRIRIEIIIWVIFKRCWANTILLYIDPVRNQLYLKLNYSFINVLKNTPCQLNVCPFLVGFIYSYKSYILKLMFCIVKLYHLICRS